MGERSLRGFSHGREFAVVVAVVVVAVAAPVAAAETAVGGDDGDDDAVDAEYFDRFRLQWIFEFAFPFFL